MELDEAEEDELEEDELDDVELDELELDELELELDELEFDDVELELDETVSGVPELDEEPDDALCPPHPTNIDTHRTIWKSDTTRINDILHRA